VLSNKVFMVFLVIMTGFFIVGGLQWPLANAQVFLMFLSSGSFEKMFSFSMVLVIVEFIAILIGFPIAIGVLRKQPAYRWMVIGILIFVAGVFLIGIFRSQIAVGIGMFLSTMGVFITTSLFFVVVANSAPRERMGFYMGFAGIPAALALIGGYIVGTIVSGLGYSGFVLMAAAIVGILGTVTALLLIIFHKKTSIEQAIPSEDEELPPLPTETEPRLSSGYRHLNPDRFIASKATMGVCIAIIPILLIAGISSMAFADMPEFNLPDFGGGGRNFGGDFDPDEFDTAGGESEMFGEYLEEQTEKTFDFNVELASDEYLAAIDIALYWEDEEDMRRVVRTFENEPDVFSLNVYWLGDSLEDLFDPISESSGSVANSHGQPGEINLHISIGHDSLGSTRGEGVWMIDVFMEEAGDFYPNGPSATYYQDTGNDFSLFIDTCIYVPE